MGLGLALALAGVLYLLRRAGCALKACVYPPTAGGDGADSGDRVRWPGPVDWLDSLLRLIAVRPLILPVLAVGAGFLSMAAYSDNFTLYVSLLLGHCVPQRN